MKELGVLSWEFSCVVPKGFGSPFKLVQMSSKYLF